MRIKICPRCSEKLVPAALKCPKCGVTVNNRTSPVLIGLIIATGVVLIAVIGLFLF